MSKRKTPFADKVPGKRPPAPNPRQASIDEMVEKIRLRAWFREGKHETVQRLRKDKGFAKAVVEHAINITISERAPLFRDAMNAAIRNRPTIERNMREGKGVWWDELEPLVPIERTHALKELRKMWQIPRGVGSIQNQKHQEVPATATPARIETSCQESEPCNQTTETQPSQTSDVGQDSQSPTDGGPKTESSEPTQ